MLIEVGVVWYGGLPECNWRQEKKVEGRERIWGGGGEGRVYIEMFAEIFAETSSRSNCQPFQLPAETSSRPNH